MLEMEKIKGIYSLIKYNEYIIAYGKGLYILNTDGVVLSQRKDLKNVFKVAFLSDDTIIADCGSIREYVIISLPTGKDIGRIKQPKMNYSCLKFVVSEDGRFVYDYYKLNCECHIARIDITQMQILFFPLDIGLRATVDHILDEDETLCFLQTQLEEISNKMVYSNGVRYEYFDTAKGYGSSYYWKAKWDFEHPKRSCQFMGSANKILTNDLYVYDVLDKSTEYLLKNDPCSWNLEKNFSNCHITKDGRYIIIFYNKSNVIIDRTNKCLIARYYMEQRQGCIVGNEFWIATDDSIICKPFPFIEG